MTTVLAVTGLSREAKIIAGPGVVTMVSGGAIKQLSEAIEAALPPHCAGIISIGIAGALDPALKVGDAVVASEVVAGDRRIATGAAWSERLRAALPEARLGAVLGSNTMVADGSAKARLHQATGALSVDMESHVAAEAAGRHSLPFAVLRFISDDASRALPKAAQAGMKPDGGMDLAAVLRSLAADPRQLPALIRTGAEAETAFRALLRGRRRLGPALGLADV